MIRSLRAVAFLALACTTAVADELPIARVFAAPALNGPVPRGVQISADGAWVTYLALSPLAALEAARRLVQGSATNPVPSS